MTRPQDGYSYWDEHPDHSVDDWQYEIANDDTRQGYWAWVQDRIDNGEDD